MSEQITVIARFKAKPETVETVIELVSKMVSQTRTEAGCLNYDFHRDLEDSTLFYMHENWASEKALAAHFEEPHLKAAFAVVPELLAEPVEIRRLRMISPKA
ncbi:MAG: putative quinol monooxygenase [Pyrinomonadaceae bacterium]